MDRATPVLCMLCSSGPDPREEVQNDHKGRGRQGQTLRVASMTILSQQAPQAERQW